MKEKRKEFKKRAKEIRKNKNAEATNNLPQDIEVILLFSQLDNLGIKFVN